MKPIAVAAFVAAIFLFSPPAAQAEDGVALGRALALARGQDWPAAAAEARLAGPLAFDIVEWQRLRAGEGSFADFADFSARRGDWPGMDLLRRKGEAQLVEAGAAEVIAYFADAPPQTGAGALALAAALAAQGRAGEAAKVVQAAWRSLTLTAPEQTVFLARHGGELQAHHGGRMQALLDSGRLAQARALLAQVPASTRAIAAARIALQERAAGVDALIAAIPAARAEKSSGLARDRAQWRWREGAEAGAAEIVLARSASAESLGEPLLWAGLRGQLARFFLRQGDARLAYKLAARHRLGDEPPEPGAQDWSDLEWLAGYAALKLGDAPTAARHFEALGAVAQTPISRARAAYWQGRAQEAMGQKAKAQAAWRAGGRWQTAYYGLLSAERAGLTLEPGFAAPPALPDWRGESFVADPVFQAAQLLQAAGASDLAERFVLHLQERLPVAQIAPLAALAEEWGNPHLGLSLAKRAANAGQVLVGAYYPLPALATHELGVPEELALAIARRESEFDPKVVSQAGARGLMQLMPATARMMAEKIGEPYDLARLTSDATYNARLGGAYLAQLRDEFGASPVLVAVGYNAGPGRARRWRDEQGDPRLATVDVIDWVEMIPFAETRNYVMRVAESLPVYRARLGRPDAGVLRFSDLLRGR